MALSTDTTQDQPARQSDFRAALSANLRPLARYITTRVRFFDAGAGVWADDNRPAELLDSVVAEALTREREWNAGTGTSMYRWLRTLAEQAMERDAVRDDQPASISLDQLTDETPGQRQHANDSFIVQQDTATEQPMLSDASDINKLSPEEQAVRQEFQHAFIAALRDLPDDLREPFLLHTRDGYDSEQVAGLEDISVEEARQKFNAASEHLRATLAREYDGLDEADDLPALDTMYEAIEDLPLDDDYLDRIAAALEA